MRKSAFLLLRNGVWMLLLKELISHGLQLHDSWKGSYIFFLRFVLFIRMDSSRRLSEMIRIKTESCSVLWNVKIVMNAEKYLFNCLEYYTLNPQGLKMMYPTDHCRILYTPWIWDKRTWLRGFACLFHMCMRERGEGDNLLNGKHLGKCYHLFNDEAKSMCTIGFRMEIGGGCLPASDADAEGFVRDSSAYFPQCDSETILKLSSQ